MQNFDGGHRIVEASRILPKSLLSTVFFIFRQQCFVYSSSSPCSRYLHQLDRYPARLSSVTILRSIALGTVVRGFASRAPYSSPLPRVLSDGVSLRAAESSDTCLPRRQQTCTFTHSLERFPSSAYGTLLSMGPMGRMVFVMIMSSRRTTVVDVYRRLVYPPLHSTSKSF